MLKPVSPGTASSLWTAESILLRFFWDFCIYNEISLKFSFLIFLVRFYQGYPSLKKKKMKNVPSLCKTDYSNYFLNRMIKFCQKSHSFLCGKIFGYWLKFFKSGQLTTYFCIALRLRMAFYNFEGLFKCMCVRAGDCNRDLRQPTKPKYLLSGPEKICWPLFYTLNQFLSDIISIRKMHVQTSHYDDDLSISPCNFAKCCIFYFESMSLGTYNYYYIFLIN